MWAFNPSAATASDATNTSGLGSGFSSGSQSNSSRSYLKLIICCFLPNSCPHTKFYPNRTKNIEFKKIGYQSALVGWSSQSKNTSIHLAQVVVLYFHEKYKGSDDTKPIRLLVCNDIIEDIT